MTNPTVDEAARNSIDALQANAVRRLQQMEARLKGLATALNSLESRVALMSEEQLAALNARLEILEKKTQTRKGA